MMHEKLLEIYRIQFDIAADIARETNKRRNFEAALEATRLTVDIAEKIHQVEYLMEKEKDARKMVEDLVARVSAPGQPPTPLPTKKEPSESN